MAELGCDTCYAQREDAPYEASDEKALAKNVGWNSVGEKGFLKTKISPSPERLTSDFLGIPP